MWFTAGDVVWVGMLSVVYCRLCGVGWDVKGGLLQAR